MISFPIQFCQSRFNAAQGVAVALIDPRVNFIGLKAENVKHLRNQNVAFDRVFSDDFYDGCIGVFLFAPRRVIAQRGHNNPVAAIFEQGC